MEIMKCDHSNEKHCTVFSRGAVSYWYFFVFIFAPFGRESVKVTLAVLLMTFEKVNTDVKKASPLVTILSLWIYWDQSLEFICFRN